MRKPKYTIRKELVETIGEEWYEYRIYEGKPKNGFSVASAKSEDEAKVWVQTH